MENNELALEQRVQLLELQIAQIMETFKGHGMKMSPPKNTILTHQHGV